MPGSPLKSEPTWPNTLGCTATLALFFVPSRSPSNGGTVTAVVDLTPCERRSVDALLQVRGSGPIRILEYDVRQKHSAAAAVHTVAQLPHGVAPHRHLERPAFTMWRFTRRSEIVCTWNRTVNWPSSRQTSGVVARAIPKLPRIQGPVMAISKSRRSAPKHNLDASG